MKTKRRPLGTESEADTLPEWPHVKGSLSGGDIAVSVDHPRLEFDSDLIRSLIHQVMKGECQRISGLEVILTTAEQLRSLNLTWKNVDYETDVLSFSLDDSSEIDGVVYVSLDFAQRHCQDFKASFHQEVCRYVTHGLLHLCGYDDDTEEAIQLIRQKEDHYLRCVGLQ